MRLFLDNTLEILGKSLSSCEGLLGTPINLSVLLTKGLKATNLI